MEITDDNSIGKLTNIYLTSVSTVLVCESKPDVEVDYWEIELDGELLTVAANVDSDVPIKTLYFRLLELTRETEYTARVRAVHSVNGISPYSNEITFTTFPK